MVSHLHKFGLHAEGMGVPGELPVGGHEPESSLVRRCDVERVGGFDRRLEAPDVSSRHPVVAGGEARLPVQSAVGVGGEEVGGPAGFVGGMSPSLILSEKADMNSTSTSSLMKTSSSSEKVRCTRPLNASGR